jgi:pimeloyl-ACP methyl ester carboxylesterase
MGNLYHSFINSKDMGDNIDAGGPVLHYIEDGEGIPLLFLHGLGFSLFTFRRQYPHFARNMRILAPDLPGCGYSRLPGNYGGAPADMAKYLNSFLTLRQARPAAVCAAGEGGIYALELALRYPDAVSALVLVSPGSLTRHFPKHIQQLINPILGEFRMSAMRQDHIRDFLKWCWFNEINIDNYVVRQVYRPFESRAARQVLLRILKEYDDRHVHENLGNVKCPTLIVWGEADAGRPCGMAEMYRREIPGARSYIIRNSGMLPHEERYREFNEVAMEFLISALPDICAAQGPDREPAEDAPDSGDDMI